MQDVFFSDEPPMTMDDYEGVQQKLLFTPAMSCTWHWALHSEAGEVLDKIKNISVMILLI